MVYHILSCAIDIFELSKSNPSFNSVLSLAWKITIDQVRFDQHMVKRSSENTFLPNKFRLFGQLCSVTSKSNKAKDILTSQFHEHAPKFLLFSHASNISLLSNTKHCLPFGACFDFRRLSLRRVATEGGKYRLQRTHPLKPIRFKWDALQQRLLQMSHTS